MAPENIIIHAVHYDHPFILQAVLQKIGYLTQGPNMNSKSQAPKEWHKVTVEQAFASLQSSGRGLTLGEVERRLQEYGPNELVEKERKTAWMMFVDQFKDFMILVLIVAGVIAGIVGDPVDTVAIAVIVLLNAVLGFIQEYRAEKAIAALKQLAAPAANVIRAGETHHVAAKSLVPGDLIVLEAGNMVPADVRIVSSCQLRIDEAALTGESLTVDKEIAALSQENLPIGDRRNMGYKGTLISYGRGLGLVVATGMSTELGRIAVLLQDQGEGKTPLQKRLATFGQRLAYVVIGICAIIFLAGVLRGEPPLLMLLTAISLAVAAIPEALPAVITISLALGAKKLVKRRALIRRLPAVETLGSITHICSDKTGTLTQNRMSVEQVYVDGKYFAREEIPEVSGGDADSAVQENPVHLLLTAFALSNDARIDSADTVVGDPTEAALLTLAMNKGFFRDKLEVSFPRVAEVPFDAERKLMTTFHEWQDGRIVSFTKGAIEELVVRSDHVLLTQGAAPFEASGVVLATETLATDGLRTLGYAMRLWDQVPDALTSKTVEVGLTLIGVAGIIDPPRPEAAESVALCRAAGIRPVMITGDHPLTAEVIARRVGILDEESGTVMTGRQLSELSLDEFEKRVDDIQVYARVSPEQKLKIVRALQDRGNFVAMTGDGVNDAPALKCADIGVAMAITGTDVSKEAAHMVLLDDNFATIVGAVREGRRIFDNIRKFIKYTMTSNLGEIVTIFVAPFLGLPIPLLPIHILWINLVTDGIPGLALAAEPDERNIMNRPPRHPKESIFAKGLGIHILWVGVLMGMVSIGTQGLFLRFSPEHWQTAVFTVLCLSQMGHVLSIRSEYESLFRQRANKPLFLAVGSTLCLQLATMYVPALNPIFKTTPLPLKELLVTILLSCVVFVAVEFEKRLRACRGSS